jgi:hypothetical protein
MAVSNVTPGAIGSSEDWIDFMRMGPESRKEAQSTWIPDALLNLMIRKCRSGLRGFRKKSDSTSKIGARAELAELSRRIPD